MKGFVRTRGQRVTVAERLARCGVARASVLAWDGEFLGVRGDFGTGGAGHDVWGGAEMAMIFPSPYFALARVSKGACVLTYRTSTDTHYTTHIKFGDARLRCGWYFCCV